MGDIIKLVIIIFIFALFGRLVWGALQSAEEYHKREASKWVYMGSSLDESNFFYNKQNIHFDGEKGFIEIKEITSEDLNIPVRCDSSEHDCDYNKKIQTVVFDCKGRHTILVKSRFYDGDHRTAGPLVEHGFRLEAAAILNKAYQFSCKAKQ
jgi:hypothetical protein